VTTGGGPVAPGRVRARALRFLAPAILLAIAGVRPAAAAAKCTITTTSNVAFGTYDVFSVAPLDVTGVVTINCNGAAHTVSVDLSSGNASSYSPRYMLKGSEQLYYNLYFDAARTLIWGDGTGATTHYGTVDPPNGVNINLTIYGRIPAAQDLTAGAYTDAIVATVNY